MHGATIKIFSEYMSPDELQFFIYYYNCLYIFDVNTHISYMKIYFPF